MKVGYISVFKDGTGYSNQATRNLLAMEAADIDLCARSVRLSQSQDQELAAKIKHIEEKSKDNVDVVIQHILPHMFQYRHGVKNIGMFCWETTNFKRSNWAHCCNLMDEIWVPSIQSAQAVKDSGVDKSVKILPCSCDPTEFDTNLPKLDIEVTKNKCVFYTVGEMTRRKNLIALIRAFYTAFSLRDDVVLVIKTNVPGKNPDEATEAIRTATNDLKKAMHIYVRHPMYPPVVALTDYLTTEKLKQLHVTGDVFVSASHGESWGIPAHDAMAFGNPVILSNWGSYPELAYGQADRYWDAETKQFKWPGEISSGWLVRGQLTPCFGHIDSFPDLYTGSEEWFEPDICHLTECMRLAYKEWQEGSLQKRGSNAKKRAFEFSHNKVGQIAKNLLEVE